MSAYHKFFILILLVSLLAFGCAPGSSVVNVKILPLLCAVEAGEQVALSLDGQIPAGTQVNWTASAGTVVWTGQGLAATFLAPAEGGEVSVTVSFVSGTPSPYTTSRICVVTSDGKTPTANNPTQTPPGNVYTIAISEVMSNPCGGNEYKKWNQYVELYNYGDQPVNVGGWFLFDEGETGTPDQLVPWVSRSAFIIDPSLVANSTVIPPRGFALILPPKYPEALLPHRMPYPILPGTIILTTATGNALGDDTFNIIGSENGYDTLTLYIGSLTVIDQVVDTYGTPFIRGPHPQDIDNDLLDNFPIYLSACHSSERIDPRLPDSAENWVPVENGTPGDGPYR